jgi:mono/diheme cytochrome c family protein
MPARGANPALSDAQIHDIIVYLRSEAQSEFGSAYLEGVDTSTAASLASQAEAEPAPTEDPNFVLPITLLGLDGTEEAPLPAADATVEAAAEPAPPNDAAARVYNQACAGCHGLGGEGVANVGTPLVGSATATDPDLLFAYLTSIQMPDPARNGFAHPSRFAFPSLATDAALRALVDYTVALAGG